MALASVATVFGVPPQTTSFEKVTVDGGGEFQVRATDALVADPRECYNNRIWVASMEGVRLY